MISNVLNQLNRFQIYEKPTVAKQVNYYIYTKWQDSATLFNCRNVLFSNLTRSVVFDGVIKQDS